MSSWTRWATSRSARERRDRLRRLGDLARDLDYVAVRVVDPELPVGGRAPPDDGEDALELAVGSELARVRAQLRDGAADHASDRDPVPARACEVHHRRLEPVACREPLVLA